MFPCLRICFAVLAITLTIACKKNNSTPVPATLSVFPTIDTIGGTVTITGTGFSVTPGDNIVQFNDSTSGTVLTATSTQLTVLVPPYNTVGKIVVKNKGMVAQTAETFTVVPKFFPQSEAPGYPITIIAGGGGKLSDYSVSFNGTVTNPTSLLSIYLTVTVPANAVNGKITVYYKGQPYTSLTDFTVAPVGNVSNVTSPGSFSQPAGLAFDPNGNLLVADLQAGYIDKVNPVNGAISFLAGNGSYSFWQSGPLLSTGIYGAYNLAFGPDGYLYTSNIWYSSLLKITPDSVINLFKYGSGGLCIDAYGNFYLTSGVQIQKVTPGGNNSIIAGTGLQGYQNGQASSAQFINPTSLLLDNKGNLFIADNTRIRVLSNGMVSDFVGGGGNGNFTDGVGSGAGFLGINSIVMDPSTGNIYAACPGEHVVRRITPAGVVTTIAGNPGHQGSQNGTGPNALFDRPSCIALDKNGNIYVSDGIFSTACIRKIQLQ